MLYEIIFVYCQKTGIIALPLFLSGLVGWYYIIDVLFFLRRETSKTKNSIKKIHDCIKKNDFSSLHIEAIGHSAAGELLKTMIKNRGSSKTVIHNTAREIILNSIVPYLARLSTVRVFTSIAPLLGLLGTVDGMIATFKIISYFLGPSSPAQ